MFDTEHFDSEATDVLTEIGEVYADEFDAPVTILTASLSKDMIVGQLMSGGDIYNYAADGNEIGFNYSPEDSEEVNEYARGFLESGYGIKTDSMDSPYEYAFGFVRLDAQVKCKKGGVACGKVCLPKGAKCKKYSGTGNASAMRQAADRLKSPGGVAAGIGAGLVGAATVAGAGGVAYLSRKELGRGAKAVGSRLKQAAKEGKEEFTKGTDIAKAALKEGGEGVKGIRAAEEKSRKVRESLGGKISRKEEYENRMNIAGAIGRTRGASLGVAAGAVKAGTQNAVGAIGSNLKLAGKDIKMTASNVAKNTGRQVKKLLGKNKPKSEISPSSKEKSKSTEEPESFPVEQTAKAIVATNQVAAETKRGRGRPKKVTE